MKRTHGLTGVAAVLALAALVVAGAVYPPRAWAQEVLVTRSLGEKRVAQLPAGPLYWRMETYPTLAAAQAAAGPTALAVEAGGRNWLLTLGARGGATPGGTRVAEVGPLPVVQAAEYLLRINEATGAPGSVTTEHSHPGSEAFYVLTGEQSIRTPTGTIRIPAGRSEAGPGGGTPLQVSNTGATDLLALVMFVVDAAQPFSSPATLPAAPLGLPRTGGVPAAVPWALGMGGVMAGLGVAMRRTARQGHYRVGRR